MFHSQNAVKKEQLSLKTTASRTERHLRYNRLRDGGRAMSVRIRSATVAFTLVCALGFASVANATDRHVPSQYPNIQAAIDACVNGDTVIVADGVYTGTGNKNISFGGKAITVRSASGPNACIIDCEGSGRGFLFNSGETSASVLDGFTIRNGNASVYGGGIQVISCSPTLNNLTFVLCTAQYAGGMDFTNSNSTMTNVVISGCTADFGGGAIKANDSTLTFDNLTVTGCSSGFYGGIDNLNSNVTITGGRITGNTSTT